MYILNNYILILTPVERAYIAAQAEIVDVLHKEQNQKKSTKAALAHIRTNPKALFAILTIAFGHVAMVSVMVMTPVHMTHVDVTLSVIGLVISVHVLGMYVFSPVVGALSDRIGRVRVMQIGFTILLLAAVIAGTARADDAITLGIGLFLLGLGWSCTLIAGSAYLSETVDIQTWRICTWDSTKIRSYYGSRFRK
jgi:MFS family permease